MAKETGASCKRCRREGEKLFLKGERCYSQKCAIERRPTPPGQHGAARQRRPSQFGEQLREKQKARKLYGVSERQFRNVFDTASKMDGITGEVFLRLLELRLDNVVFRMGLAPSRTAARQLVSHGHVLVNGKKLDVPSARLREGDEVALKPGAEKKAGFADVEKRMPQDAPAWLALNVKDRSAKVMTHPSLDDIGHSLNMRLIVEFYSR